MADTFIGLVNREGLPGFLDNNTTNITEGTSTNASALIELRFRQGASITKKDLRLAMATIYRWILEGGQTNGNDTNLPIL